jgi:general secretion pathway protein G
VIGKKPEMHNAKRETKKNCRGFSLLELMIAMFILIILLSVALPTFQYTVQHAKETVLKENIHQIEKQIDQFTADKGRLPQSLDELVEAKYLREKPVDPILEKAEWEEVMGEDPSGEGKQGLIDVKSTADGEDSNGKSYKEY